MLRYYCGNQNSSSRSMDSTFSLFFPLSKSQWPVEEACDDRSSITSPSSPSSSSTSSVDCTLSLGTPSSRRAEPTEPKPGPAYQPPFVSTMCWDAVAESNYCQGKPMGPKGGASLGSDPLLPRRCANCNTTSTPLWRNGPRGPKSLCNACGIRYKKEERRAAATAENDGGGGCGYSAQRLQQQQWGCYGSAAKAAPNVMHGHDAMAGGDAEASFLAWRLNVVAPATPFPVWPERPSFQYN